MSIVNETGGHHFTITAIGTEENSVESMLKSQILKKSQNWSVQLTDFVVSKQPLLNNQMHKERFLTVLPIEGVPAVKEPRMQQVFGEAFHFTPECTSIIQLFKELKRFCRTLSHIYYTVGVTNLFPLVVEMVPFAPDGANS